MKTEFWLKLIFTALAIKIAYVIVSVIESVVR